MKKLLSIIIPTYNMEACLDDCIKSLIVNEEQLPMLEVLVINDGSKDASSDIAHRQAERYPDTIIVIDKENGHYGSCINCGLKHATGKYVKVLDADDHFDTPSLPAFLDLLKDTDTDLVLTDNVIYGDHNYSKTRYDFNLSENVVMDFTSICATNDFKTAIQMHHVTYNMDIFKRFEYHQTEGITFTDMEWIFAPMARVKTMIYYRLPLYRYLVGRQLPTDSQVVKTSVRNYMVLANSMLNHYKEADKSLQSIKDYLDFRLLLILKYIYRIFLVESPHLDLSPLKLFDKRLKADAPQLYDELGKRTIGPFIRIKYIDYWRHHQYGAIPDYFYTIFNIYNKTLVWCKRLFGINNL